MTQHIGIVAASSEGAALCYRTVCLEAAATMGQHAHPEVSMHTFCLADYMRYGSAGEWGRVAEMMLGSARKLAAAGADFFICPDNTNHVAFDQLVERSPKPWLHIADAVADEAKRRGFARLGILGTKYLMESRVYSERLGARRIESMIPEAPDRAKINDVIFQELTLAKFTDASRAAFGRIIDGLRGAGCDAVVLGCTEIPLLISPEDSSLPTLDSTRLLARAALARATAS